MRVLEERKDDEKVIHSKARLLAETPPPAAEAGPSQRDKAADFIVPEAVFPTDDDEDDDFEVTFGFGLWCHCTDSASGWNSLRKPRIWVQQSQGSDHGRGGEELADSS